MPAICASLDRLFADKGLCNRLRYPCHGLVAMLFDFGEEPLVLGLHIQLAESDDYASVGESLVRRERCAL